MAQDMTRVTSRARLSSEGGKEAEIAFLNQVSVANMIPFKRVKLNDTAGRCYGSETMHADAIECPIRIAADCKSLIVELHFPPPAGSFPTEFEICFMTYISHLSIAIAPNCATARKFRAVLTGFWACWRCET